MRTQKKKIIYFFFRIANKKVICIKFKRINRIFHLLFFLSFNQVSSKLLLCLSFFPPCSSCITICSCHSETYTFYIFPVCNTVCTHVNKVETSIYRVEYLRFILTKQTHSKRLVRAGVRASVEVR